MHVAILTLDGFNELDSFIALGLLNRVKRPNWRVSLMAPTAHVTSMNGVTVARQADLDELPTCSAVLLGSGVRTREFAQHAALLERLAVLDPARQLIGAQCSGTLLLARLGLLDGIPACTDLTTQPWVQEAGIHVLPQPFFARGNLATAGGCLASSYLATWVIARSFGREAATEALRHVAPVGEKDAYVARAWARVAPYIAVGERCEPERLGERC